MTPLKCIKNSRAHLTSWPKYLEKQGRSSVPHEKLIGLGPPKSPGGCYSIRQVLPSRTLSSNKITLFDRRDPEHALSAVSGGLDRNNGRKALPQLARSYSLRATDDSQNLELYLETYGSQYSLQNSAVTWAWETSKIIWATHSWKLSKISGYSLWPSEDDGGNSHLGEHN